jgi:hypothetical protein
MRRRPIVAEDRYRACARELADTPELVAQLLEDHTPRPDGWCRAHDVHAERHPCSIRRLAELADTYVVAGADSGTRS